MAFAAESAAVSRHGPSEPETRPEIIVAGAGETVVHLIAHSERSLKVVRDTRTLPCDEAASIDASGVLRVSAVSSSRTARPSTLGATVLILEAKGLKKSGAHTPIECPPFSDTSFHAPRRDLAYLLLYSNSIYRISILVLRAGESTDKHTLPHPGAVVFLSDAQITSARLPPPTSAEERGRKRSKMAQTASEDGGQNADTTRSGGERRGCEQVWRALEYLDDRPDLPDRKVEVLREAFLPDMSAFGLPSSPSKLARMEELQGLIVEAAQRGRDHRGLRQELCELLHLVDPFASDAQSTEEPESPASLHEPGTPHRQAVVAGRLCGAEPRAPSCVRSALGAGLCAIEQASGATADSLQAGRGAALSVSPFDQGSVRRGEVLHASVSPPLRPWLQVDRSGPEPRFVALLPGAPFFLLPRKHMIRKMACSG